MQAAKRARLAGVWEADLTACNVCGALGSDPDGRVEEIVLVAALLRTALFPVPALPFDRPRPPLAALRCFCGKPTARMHARKTQQKIAQGVMSGSALPYTPPRSRRLAPAGPWPRSQRTGCGMHIRRGTGRTRSPARSSLRTHPPCDSVGCGRGHVLRYCAVGSFAVPAHSPSSAGCVRSRRYTHAGACARGARSRGALPPVIPARAAARGACARHTQAVTRPRPPAPAHPNAPDSHPAPRGRKTAARTRACAVALPRGQATHARTHAVAGGRGHALAGKRLPRALPDAHTPRAARVPDAPRLRGRRLGIAHARRSLTRRHAHLARLCVTWR